MEKSLGDGGTLFVFLVEQAGRLRYVPQVGDSRDFGASRLLLYWREALQLRVFRRDVLLLRHQRVEEPAGENEQDEGR